MNSIHRRILEECVPDAFRLAADFIKSFTELELMQIRDQFELIALSPSKTVYYRKFVVAYLAILLCLEAPSILIDLSEDLVSARDKLTDRIRKRGEMHCQIVH